MNKKELTSSLDFIRLQLDVKLADGDPIGTLEKINTLSSIMGLSAECYANAERLYNERLGEVILEYAKSDLNTTDKRLLFQGKLAEEIRLMTLAEGYSKKLDKVIEALRSVISYLKEEYKQMR